MPRNDARVIPAPPAALRRAAAPAAAVLLAGLWTALAIVGAAPAHAVPPLSDVEGDVTDQVGVLEGRADEVQEALDRLAAETQYQLFVVYVESFDGVDGVEWANATANNADLGRDDLLLAVATEDRVYGLSVDHGIGLTDAELDRVQDAAVDALRADDWAGAAVAAADATVDVAGGSGGLGGVGGDGVPTGALLGVGAVALAGIGGYAWYYSRRRTARAGTAVGSGRHAGPGAPGQDPLESLSTADLDRRAGSALVSIDDAIKTSEQELGFAQAEFGLEATQEFQAALEQAKQDVARAFRIRQELDDELPETEPQRRQMLVELLRLCDGAADALDAQTTAFDNLRRLQARAPQVLDETEQRAAEIADRIEVARQTLAGLRATYPASALESVATNPEQAVALVENARAAVTEGRAAIQRRKKPLAVAHARAAQNALGQAVTLLDAVASAGTDLAEAGPRLDKGIASVTQDISDAGRLAPDDPAVSAARAEAEAAVARARHARDGGDPIAALARLTAAEAALDNALAPARQKAETDARAAALLRETLARVDAQVRATNDYVATRRGAVGPQARTRLAEAARLADEARALQTQDPTAALERAQQAERYATQASHLAQQDTSGWGMQQQGGPGGNVGGMVLGGILLDSILRGGGGYGGTGGFGGGGFGGSRGGSRRSGGGLGGGFGGGGFGGGRRGGGFSGGRGGGRSRGGRF